MIECLEPNQKPEPYFLLDMHKPNYNSISSATNNEKDIQLQAVITQSPDLNETPESQSYEKEINLIKPSQVKNQYRFGSLKSSSSISNLREKSLNI